MTDVQSKVNIPLYPPSGTRDFYPDDMQLRNWLFGKWKNVSERYGFRQYDAPVLEHSSLYTRKGGDDILKEMFSFEMDGIGLSLRPEMTPTLCRMLMEYIPSAVMPIKWYSFPQCWRNETTSKGRKREHYQWNVDVFGGERVKSELEIFLIITSFFKSVGLKSSDVKIRVSNRMILQTVLKGMGLPDDKFVDACNAIDKIAKVNRKMMGNMLGDLGLTEENVDNIYKLCEVKDVNGLRDYLPEDDPTLKEITTLFTLAENVGIGEWLQFDASIVRGLSYYTGTVFEGFFMNSTIKRAVCGGGRYDNLLGTYGYRENVPAIGFGFGDVVILEVLKEMNLLPKLGHVIDYVVIPFNDDYYGDAVNVSEKILEKGKVNGNNGDEWNKYVVEVYMKGGKLKSAFDYANSKNAKFVVLIAGNEWKDGSVVVKDMKGVGDQKQKTMLLTDFLESI
ncbi:Histidine-tRNA synthetase [Orpheovirus IHUMI-LCC2]|uniref:histidine--tRNA ligase n=1 Tax=Orpheovirus IHUMI-LCC2 TaxID=2023057 RepID=A0A2I2L577_9VIRU|nr:Histidine-tRNA synthetase [Orpheovirus IHUMI-LCC2]SNW62698.1 Histidine-tRNA synthetase [Orpheovirus IHUMI-LCC2]